MSSSIVGRSREHFDNGGIDNEGYTKEETAVDLQWAAANRVNCQDAHCRASESNDGIDGL